MTRQTKFIVIIIAAFMLLSLGGCSAYERFLARSSVYFVTYTDAELERLRVGPSETIDVPEIDREGYTFDGWYTDDSFLSPFYETTPITDDVVLYAKWVPNTYDITFVIDGREQTIPMTYGDPLNLENVQKTGHELIALYTDSNFFDEFTDWTVPARNTKLYTSWRRESYTIQFKLPDGHLLQEADYLYEESLPLTPYERIGYDFLGWFADSDLSEPFTLDTMPDYDFVLFGSYEPMPFTITFETGEGAPIQPLTIDYGESIILDDARYAGYDFLGWYFDSNHSEPMDLTTMPANDFILYAKYEPKTYELTIHPENETDIIVRYHDYDTEIGELPTPERTGFTFDGWYLDTDHDIPYTYVFMPDHDVDIYAQWSRNIYTIEFVTDPHGPLPDLSLPFESEVSLDSLDLKGHTFDGWFIDEAFDTPFTIETMPAHDLTVYAKFIVNDYHMTVHPNNGDQSYVLTYPYGSTIPDPDVPNHIGFSFTAWYMDENLASRFTLETMPDYDIDVYAGWSRNTYTISFDTDPHPAIEPMTVLYEDPITLLTLTLEGHSFDGWYLDLDRTVPYQLDTMPAYDFTLYADFTVNTYTITVHPDETTDSYELEFTYGHPVDTLAPPNREGHSFTGWFMDDDWTIPFDHVTMPAENLSVYGGWSVNSYTISYATDLANPIPDAIVRYDEPIPLPDLEAYGHAFNGWYEDQERTLLVVDERMPAYDLTLYADFIPNTHDLAIYIPQTYIQSATGFGFSFALTENGQLYAIGKNNTGQLGIGTTENADEPIDITDRFDLNPGESLQSVVAGWSHGYALSSMGRLFAWGNNLYGQIGNGTTSNQTTPVDITMMFALEQDETILKVVSGYYHGIVLTSFGRVMTWGINYQNELGDGTAIPSKVPVDITEHVSIGPTDKIIDIATHAYHSFATTSSGEIHGWGKNINGQLAIDTMNNQSFPVRIDEILGLASNEVAVMIALGSEHSLILTSANRLFAFGDNEHGQLGIGNRNDQPVPRDITPLLPLLADETIDATFAGHTGSSVLTSLGRMLVFGNNDHGQLSDIPFYDILTPSEVNGQLSLTVGETPHMMEIGINHAMILTSKGRLFTWGDNTTNQLLSSSAASVHINRLHSVVEVDYSTPLERYTPQWTGFVLDGWYVDPLLTSVFTDENMPDHDLSLYLYYASITDNPDE